MWMPDDLGFLLRFVDNIKNDQAHFLPSMASGQYAPEVHISHQWAQRLSKNFAQGVYSCSFFAA
jgi:hypothetical protein